MKCSNVSKYYSTGVHETYAIENLGVHKLVWDIKMFAYYVHIDAGILLVIARRSVIVDLCVIPVCFKRIFEYKTITSI